MDRKNAATWAATLRNECQTSVLTIDTLGAYGYAFGVPRKLRIEYPGAIYHVMNRGDQREAIFRADEDRQELVPSWTCVSNLLNEKQPCPAAQEVLPLCQ